MTPALIAASFLASCPSQPSNPFQSPDPSARQNLILNLNSPLEDRSLFREKKGYILESFNRRTFLEMVHEEIHEETKLKNPLFFGQNRFYSQVDLIEFEMNQKKMEGSNVEKETVVEDEKEVDETADKE